MQVKVRTLERGLSIDSSPTAHSVRNGSPNAKSRREDLTSPDLRIVRFAVASRVTVIALSVLSDWIIPDHKPDPSVERLSTSRWLRAFTRWDAARFTTIALEGYQKEEDYAFMPVLPMAMSIGTRALGILVPHIGPSATVAIGLVITNCCFVLAAWLLYRLGLLVLRDQLLAFRSAMVFCFSPANVFFSSVYTESPFAACSFGGLLLLELNRPWLGALLFGIGTGLRSNGILNAGFLAYQCLFIIVQDLQRGHTLLRTLVERSRKHAVLMLGVALSVGPFVVFQAYAWQKECYAGDACAEAGECKLSEQPPDWCQGSMPSIYMHVQKKYWQGGLFCYWQLKQIPNFALAAPALALTASGVHHILTDFGRQLGRWTEVSCESKPTPRAGAALYRAVLVCPLLPHALHWGFLSTYLLLCANVQIATRVLGSGCPVFHWFLASLLFSRSPGKTSRLLKCYIGIFNCLGIIMHPNFLPWT